MAAHTLAEQILGHAAGHEVSPGDLVIVPVDRCMTHDSLTPGVIDAMRVDLDGAPVRYPERVAVFIDHVAPASTVSTANGQVKVRNWVRDEGIAHFFDVGRGVCHQVMIEEGLVAPGQIALGTDSHATAYGAVGAFGTGVGTRDMALALATGQTWLRVPETVRVQASGRFQPGCAPKDLSLYLCGSVGMDGATYQAVEFHGMDWLDLDGRETLSSMTTELGAKAGMFAPTGVGAEGLEAPAWLRIEDGAQYHTTINVDLDQLSPQVAVPDSVDSVSPVEDVAGQRVEMVFIGTCTNGRLSDMQAAAEILRGQRIAPHVRLLVIPASHRILQGAVADGTLSTLLDAGATLGTPGCGPCIGRHMGVIGAGETCFSTANRNFRGRMGSPEGSIYLGSAETAAATALRGCITDPRTL